MVSVFNSSYAESRDERRWVKVSTGNKVSKTSQNMPGIVAHAFNSSYTEGGVRRIQSERGTRQKVRCYLKKITKVKKQRTRCIAQVVEFFPRKQEVLPTVGEKGKTQIV